MFHVYNDGGREAAGYKGQAGDCVVRAIAIASDLPYQQVYDRIANGCATERKTKYNSKGPRDGVYTGKKWFKEYMASLGWHWVPTMGIGTGCTVHLSKAELPDGRLVVALSRHYTAVVNGIIYDNHDPQRNETRCVYGYWVLKN